MALSDTNRRQSSNFVELVGDNENDKSTESGLTNARVEPKETYPNQNPSISTGPEVGLAKDVKTGRKYYFDKREG